MAAGGVFPRAGEHVLSYVAELPVSRKRSHSLDEVCRSFDQAIAGVIEPLHLQFTVRGRQVSAAKFCEAYALGRIFSTLYDLDESSMQRNWDLVTVPALLLVWSIIEDKMVEELPLAEAMRVVRMNQRVWEGHAASEDTSAAHKTQGDVSAADALTNLLALTRRRAQQAIHETSPTYFSLFSDAMSELLAVQHSEVYLQHRYSDSSDPAPMPFAEYCKMRGVTYGICPALSIAPLVMGSPEVRLDMPAIHKVDLVGGLFNDLFDDGSDAFNAVQILGSRFAVEQEVLKIVQALRKADTPEAGLCFGLATRMILIQSRVYTSV